MTIRAILWTPQAQAVAQKLPLPLKKQVRTRLAALATGPLPPEDALPDLDLPSIYHVVSSGITMIAGVYEDELRAWLLRVNS